MANRLTVIIPCKDEGHNIQACVESVRPVADEVIVADSGSTDGTLAVVRRMGGCRIIEREFVDYSDFKNWAAGHASHPWVLFVDADERLTDPLAAEINELLAGEPEAHAYRVRFEPFFLGFRIKHCGWNTTSAVRLYRREECRWDSRRVHESVRVKSGETATLRGKILHFSCRSWSQWLAKLDRYTTLAAEEKYAAGCRAGFRDLLLRPPLQFLKSYVLRAGFLDGAAGLAVCGSTAFYTFMKYAKLWHLGAGAARSGEVGKRGRWASGPARPDAARRAA
jgi:glycosyltransferase involved in cell wall biosynthesis